MTYDLRLTPYPLSLTPYPSRLTTSDLRLPTPDFDYISPLPSICARPFLNLHKPFRLRKVFLIIGLTGLAIAAFFYWVLFSSNTGDFHEKAFLYIPTGATYARVLDSLQQNHILRDIKSFDRLARRLNYPDRVKPGKYQVKEGMGNFTIIQLLKGGKQVPVRLVLNKMRTPDEIIRKICSQLEADSNDMKQLFRDTAFLSQYHIDSNQVQVILLPDTYQFFWNTNARKAIEKIAKNHAKFWTAERRQKADQLGLSIPEVVTLASIIEEETNKEDDKPRIASTYLNRLKLHMPLQADPTLKYALRDFSLRRILQGHTQVNSPYNTYRNAGLPPGPICTPNLSTVDATLDAPATDYLYFCAREDFSGYSNFAATYAEHQVNARKYQDALNQRGIR